MSENNSRRLLTELFQSAVDSVSADNCLPSHLTSLRRQKIHVIGAGKAAAVMAKVIEDNFAGQVAGLVVTRYEHAVPVDLIDVIEAAHPVPDQFGLTAAKRIMTLAQSLGPDDFVVCAMSGGASSLLTLPHPKINFEDKQSISQQLLLGGASIQELNCVRKHLSAIKGGSLMSAVHPAEVLTLCISDVVGDDPTIIGSGPTVGDPSTCEEVLDVVNRYQINTPGYIRTLLERGELETPKPGSSIFDNSEVRVIARPFDALQASLRFAEQQGITVMMLGDTVAGDTNEVAAQHAELVKRELANAPIDKPLVIISGGETTVTVTGSGKGGPNTQYALALALELENISGVYAIACDTDGVDGSEDNAGALLTPSTLTRARKLGINPREFLRNNDAYSFFERLNDLVITGPTLTNVNDFRAILYLPA